MADPYLALPPTLRLAGTLDLALLTRENAPDVAGARISAFSALQFAAIDPAIIHEFTDVQSDSWEAEHLAVMTLEQGGQITADQIRRFTPLRLSRLSANAFGALSGECLAALTTLQLGALTKDQGKKMVAATITALTVPRFGSVSPAAFSGIHSDHIRSLHQDRVAEITAAQTGLMAELQLRFFDAAKIQFLSGAALGGIPHALFTLTNVPAAKVAQFQPAQAPSITRDQFGRIPTEAFASLMPLSFAAITDAHFAALTVEQAKKITPLQAVRLVAAKLTVIRGYPTVPSVMAVIPAPSFRQVPDAEITTLAGAARHLESVLGVNANLAVEPQWIHHLRRERGVRTTATTGNGIRWIKVSWSLPGFHLHLHFNPGNNTLNTAQHKIRPDPWDGDRANECKVNSLTHLATQIEAVRVAALAIG